MFPSRHESGETLDVEGLGGKIVPVGLRRGVCIARVMCLCVAGKDSPAKNIGPETSKLLRARFDGTP